jgi:hypothetical protein
MERSRREKLIPVLPTSKVKPLKYSIKDKFANTMEIKNYVEGAEIIIF